MVAEISPGVFKCSRFLCHQTVTAERPNNKRSRAQAQRAATVHEARNAIHLAILDLSTLPPNPNKPNAIREGFVVVLGDTDGWGFLSKPPEIFRDVGSAEFEASVLTEFLDSRDYRREKRGDRFARSGSIMETQNHLDHVRLINQLLKPTVLSFKSKAS